MFLVNIYKLFLAIPNSTRTSEVDLEELARKSNEFAY